MQELVYLKNDEAVCDSLQVAEKFHKRHSDVIRAIENLIENDSTQNCVQCFKRTAYKDDRGKVVRIVSKWKLKQIMEDYILLPVMILILPIAFFMHWLAFGY